MASTCTIAKHIKQLIQSIRHQDETTKELEAKLDTFDTILEQASSAYGPDESSPRSPSEERMRQATRKVIIRCNKDLNSFEAKLKNLASHKNRASVAWRQQFVVPTLASTEKSISHHEQQLSMLVQLLQGSVTDRSQVQILKEKADLSIRLQLHQLQERQTQILGMLQKSPYHSAIHAQVDLTGGDEIADTDSMIQQVTSALIGEAESGDMEDAASNTNTLVEAEESASQNYPESNANGTLLLEAIQEGDNDTFESLLQDACTSFNEKDIRERTPLLLAAHLGKVEMMKRLLANCTRTTSNGGGEKASSSHCDIDLSAIDNLGRTALHYCAEFDICDAAGILIDRGINVNARDYVGNPPAYYAVKYRKYNAVQLLLSKGATTDFTWPKPTSAEIEKLLEKASNEDRSVSISSSGSRHNSVSTPTGRRSSLMRRWRSANV